MQVPETKGLSLEEMDEAFGDAGRGLARKDLDRQAEINRRIGLDAYMGGAHDIEEKDSATDEKQETVHVS